MLLQSEENKIDTELTQHRLAMREFDYQVRCNRPLIYICTHEESRVLDAVKMICDRGDRNWEMFTWDVADGLKAYTNNVIIEEDERA